MRKGGQRDPACGAAGRRVQGLRSRGLRDRHSSASVLGCCCHTTRLPACRSPKRQWPSQAWQRRPPPTRQPACSPAAAPSQPLGSAALAALAACPALAQVRDVAQPDHSLCTYADNNCHSRSRAWAPMQHVFRSPLVAGGFGGFGGAATNGGFGGFGGFGAAVASGEARHVRLHVQCMLATASHRSLCPACIP